MYIYPAWTAYYVNTRLTIQGVRGENLAAAICGLIHTIMSAKHNYGQKKPIIEVARIMRSINLGSGIPVSSFY